MGTKVRHFSSNNPKEIEAFIEGLNFLVEIKSVYSMGGRHFIWFTMFNKDQLQSDVFPSPEEKVPPAKKTKKTINRKKKI